jgi:hypothetical protein
MRLHRKHGYERQRPAKSVLRVTLRERDKELKESNNLKKKRKRKYKFYRKKFKKKKKQN